MAQPKIHDETCRADATIDPTRCMRMQYCLALSVD